MDCEAAKNLIGAWVDRQLPAAEAVALEAHLSMCEDCRAASESVRGLDADLLRAFQPHRQAATEVAGRVLKALDAEQPRNVTTLPASKIRWWPLLLTTAAGFLLATLLFQPWKASHPQINPPIVAKPAMQPAVAQLVAMTGEVQVRKPAGAGWQACTNLFECPTGSLVRTGPYVQCELKTAEGCVIRLNDETEIKLISADQIEIQQGQIWCSAPQNNSLKVVASEAKRSPNSKVEKYLSYLACPSSSCALAKVQRNGGLQVTTAEGVTELQTPSDRTELRQGESASIVHSEIVKGSQTSDLILATAWIHPLLIQKGRDNKELADRVSMLLAKIGESKLDNLYEREIRRFGEYAALPLFRYVQSPLSAGNSSRRLKAIRILSDVAPRWAIPDLLPLLSDKDGDVRFYTAKALERLTGLDQGRPAEQWRDPLDKCQPTIERWRQWRPENRDQAAPVETLQKV